MMPFSSVMNYKEIYEEGSSNLNTKKRESLWQLTVAALFN